MHNRPHFALLQALSLGCLIVCPFAARGAEVEFRLRTLDPTPPDKPYYKLAGDVTGDGLADVMVGGAKGPLVLYEAPDWKRTQIAAGGWDGVNGELGDIDNDGDLDLVMGGTAWFRNPGRRGGTWERVLIEDQKAHDIELADLNRDGRLDVVARDQSAFGKNGNWIIIYYQPQQGPWEKVRIDCEHGEGLKVADIDADEDADIVIGRVWYENPGTSRERWRPHSYAAGWTEPDTQIEVADINGDGRQDIVVTPSELKDESYKICWYEAPESPRQEAWREHVVLEPVECVFHSLGVGDLDGDGRIDIAVAEMHQGRDPDEVSVLWNRDGGTTWQKQVLSQNGSHDIVVVDLEQDGDLDIVGANHAGTHPLEWWQNLRNPR